MRNGADLVIYYSQFLMRQPIRYFTFLTLFKCNGNYLVVFTKLQVKEAFTDQGRVVMGKVDCEKEAAVASRFQITKYPTLKIIRNGQTIKREYRGQRSAEAFLEFVKKQLEDPIKEFHNLKDLEKLDSKKRIIVGYFDRYASVKKNFLTNA